MNPWICFLRGLKRAAIPRVEATIARVLPCPVRRLKRDCKAVTLPKYNRARMALSAPYTRVRLMIRSIS